MHATRYTEMQRGYIFDEQHLVVCEYSICTVSCEREQEACLLVNLLVPPLEADLGLASTLSLPWWCGREGTLGPGRSRYICPTSEAVGTLPRKPLTLTTARRAVVESR